MSEYTFKGYLQCSRNYTIKNKIKSEARGYLSILNMILYNLSQKLITDANKGKLNKRVL